MKQFQVTVNTWEEASIDYRITLDADSEEKARDMVNKAIKRDGTAFIEFSCDKEQIMDTIVLDSEVEMIETIVEVTNIGDKHEDHF